jgi:hypothetical protein
VEVHSTGLNCPICLGHRLPSVRLYSTAAASGSTQTALALAVEMARDMSDNTKAKQLLHAIIEMCEVSQAPVPEPASPPTSHTIS